MHLNHPETIPTAPWSMEKLSSTKPVPGAKKVGDRALEVTPFTTSVFSYCDGWLHISKQILYNAVP